MDRERWLGFGCSTEGDSRVSFVSSAAIKFCICMELGTEMPHGCLMATVSAVIGNRQLIVPDRESS